MSRGTSDKPKREWPMVYASIESTCPACRGPILIGHRIRPSRRGWRHLSGNRGRCVVE